MSQIDDLPPLRDVIATHGLRAKKELGQNFLLDLNLTSRIARAAGRLEVISADALEVDFTSLANGAVKIVANLPYNIATPLLTGWLTTQPWPPFFESMTLMFQKEVAQRICAKPGSKTYGRLSVLAGWRTDAHIAFNVDRSAFTPAPKVTSSIVHLVPREVDPDIPVSALENVTRAAFGQRRKMVRQSLKGLGVSVEELLKAGDLKGTERAEELPVSIFLELAKALVRQKS